MAAVPDVGAIMFDVSFLYVLLIFTLTISFTHVLYLTSCPFVSELVSLPKGGGSVVRQTSFFRPCSGYHWIPLDTSPLDTTGN